mmetsp:Transcript_27093/g.52747  ORF Transcript_27093/g.52747 Transcript_27093/m.52747 type:complete len:268 (-) Transcript_27093:622-1425(-)
MRTHQEISGAYDPTHACSRRFMASSRRTLTQTTFWSRKWSSALCRPSYPSRAATPAGVSCLSSLRTSAWGAAARSSASVSPWPLAAAQCAGVCPLSLPRTLAHQVELRASADAPAASSARTTAVCPPPAAQCSGVEPLIARASTGQPARASTCTANVAPAAAARCSAAAPDGGSRAWRSSRGPARASSRSMALTSPSPAACKKRSCSDVSRGSSSACRATVRSQSGSDKRAACATTEVMGWLCSNSSSICWSGSALRDRSDGGSSGP